MSLPKGPRFPYKDNAPQTNQTNDGELERFLDQHAEAYVRATKDYIIGKITEDERNESWHKQDLRTKTAITHLIASKEKAAIQGFCQKIADKVRLEFESGGRYPGHIIDPWIDVAAPIIYAELQAEGGGAE